MTEPFETTTRAPGKPNAVNAETRDALLLQYQLTQQTHKEARENASLLEIGVEAGHAALYQGAQAPILSLAQMADGATRGKTNLAGLVDVLPAPEEAKFGSGLWWAQQFGGGAGMVPWFMATKGGLSKAGLSFAARTETATLAGSRLMSMSNAGLVADGAIAGYAYDAFLRPVDPSQVRDGSQWKTRFLEHGPAGAATFGTLTAGSVLLRHGTRGLAQSLVEGPRANRVLYDIGMGTLPGIPAGVVNADVSAKLSKGRWATMEERWKGGATMAAAGGMLSAFHSVPGSEVPLGEVASAYQSRKADVDNLNAMLARRAVATPPTVEATTPTTARPVKGEPVLGGGNGGTRDAGSSSTLLARGTTNGVTPERVTTERQPGSGSDQTARGGRVEPGKTLASGDVEGRVAEGTAVDVVVPRELVPVLEKGAQLAFNASDVNCTPAQVSEFFQYARGEGKPLKEAMLQVASSYGDPRLLTIVREAYLPPEGVQHRVVEGDIKIKTPGATDTQYQRWGQFMQIVKDMPSDVEGYTRFRHDVFRWLNENPELHDWARQYGEQNRFSKVAGPLDYYFGTSNLGRFMEVADGTRPANEAPVSPARTEGSQVQKLVEGEGTGPIRLDLSAAEAERGRLVESGQEVRPDPTTVTKPFGDLNLAAERPGGLTLEAPVKPGINARMEAFERANPTRKRIDAMKLADNIGEMSTEQFARWLDYAYSKPEGATTDSATNLRSLWIQGRDVLLRPEVIEAYRQYRGVGEPGATPGLSLEAVRQFLSTPPATGRQPMAEWLKFYVEARVEQAQEAASPEAKPHEVLNAAIPRWLQENLRGQYTTESLGGTPEYAPELPVEIAQRLEAARQTQPPKRQIPGRPEKEYKPPTNDTSFRLARLDEVMKVEDPVIRQRLLELGAVDQTALRNILQKLDPERAAPEYKELLRMVLPNAQHPAEVKLLLDAIFFGNKEHRTDRDSNTTRMHQQLAMAAAEHLVPQSDANFARTQQIVNDMINGTIRDPRPDFGDGPGGRPGFGGRDGGRPGRDGGRDQRGGGRDAGRRDGGTQPAASTAPPKATPILRRDANGALTYAEPQAGSEAQRVASGSATEQAPRIVVDLGTGGEQGRTGNRVETDPATTNGGAADRVVIETTGERPAGETGERRVEPVVETERRVEQPVEETRVEADAAAPKDLSTLRSGSKVKVGGRDATFIAVDAHTGDAIVRNGKSTPQKEQFYGEKQFGKLKWHEVGRDNSTSRTLYRNRDGQVFEVRPHGSGFMTTPRPEYQGVKPTEVQ